MTNIRSSESSRKTNLEKSSSKSENDPNSGGESADEDDFFGPVKRKNASDRRQQIFNTKLLKEQRNIETEERSSQSKSIDSNAEREAEFNFSDNTSKKRKLKRNSESRGRSDDVRPRNGLRRERSKSPLVMCSHRSPERTLNTRKDTSLRRQESQRKTNSSHLDNYGGGHTDETCVIVKSRSQPGAYLQSGREPETRFRRTSARRDGKRTNESRKRPLAQRNDIENVSEVTVRDSSPDAEDFCKSQKRGTRHKRSTTNRVDKVLGSSHTTLHRDDRSDSRSSRVSALKNEKDSAVRRTVASGMNSSEEPLHYEHEKAQRSKKRNIDTALVALFRDPGPVNAVSRKKKNKNKEVIVDEERNSNSHQRGDQAASCSLVSTLNALRAEAMRLGKKYTNEELEDIALQNEERTKLGIKLLRLS